MLVVLDPNQDMVWLGHGLETQWMVMDEACRVGDTALFLLAAARFRRHVEAARDPVFGGLFCGMRVDEARACPDKVLWVHQEALIGLLLLLARRRLLPAAERGAQGLAGWAVRTHRELHGWVLARFPLSLPAHGGGGRALWAITLARDGSPADGAAVASSSPQRVAARKENYHHPRFLMLCTELIDEICCEAE